MEADGGRQTRRDLEGIQLIGRMTMDVLSNYFEPLSLYL